MKLNNKNKIENIVMNFIVVVVLIVLIFNLYDKLGKYLINNIKIYNYIRQMPINISKVSFDNIHSKKEGYLPLDADAFNTMVKLIKTSDANIFKILLMPPNTGRNSRDFIYFIFYLKDNSKLKVIFTKDNKTNIINIRLIMKDAFVILKNEDRKNEFNKLLDFTNKNHMK